MTRLHQMQEEKQQNLAIVLNNTNNELEPLLSTSNTISCSTPLPYNVDCNSNNSSRSEAIGLALITLNALSLALMNMSIKLIGHTIPSFEISMFSSTLETILCLIACASIGIKNPVGPRHIRGWLAARGMSGALAMGTIFYSMTHLPLGDASVIANLNPIFTVMLAAVMLHEPFHIFEGVCTVLCLTGTALVTKPGFLFSANNSESPASDNNADSTRTLGIISGLTGAIMIAFMYITTRKVGTTVHFLVIVLYSGVITTLVSVTLLFSVQNFVKPPSVFEYGILFLVGILQFVGHCIMGKGLQLAPAGPASVMRTIEIALAFMFGIFVFHEYPDGLSVLGATIIAVTTTLLAWRKWRRSNNNHSAVQPTS